MALRKLLEMQACSDLHHVSDFRTRRGSCCLPLSTLDLQVETSACHLQLLPNGEAQIQEDRPLTQKSRSIFSEDI